ncbi:MAG: Na(+)-translocating NADH-quinone reductase subunit C [Planctomycetaceae bacterium]
MSRDSIGNILRVSILLCLVCAIGVSLAAVGLKERQDENKRRDQKRNVLVATGNYDPEKLDSKTVDAEFEKNVETRWIDLETDTEVPAESLPDGADYDPRSSTNLDVALPSSPIGVRNRARYYPVYYISKDGQLDTVVLPIFGNGLWSTMYGFLALEPDLTTVRGINYYEHGETPGLGGEVDNPFWKQEWKGKIAYEDGQPAINVIKGNVDGSNPNAPHQIDGLAGATITANGVDKMVNYWLGDEGFGKYLEKQRSTQTASRESRVES